MTSEPFTDPDMVAVTITLTREQAEIAAAAVSAYLLEQARDVAQLASNGDRWREPRERCLIAGQILDLLAGPGASDRVLAAPVIG